MPESTLLRVEENRPLARGVYAMRLAGDTGAQRRPGQFVGLKIPGFYLRRPFSVCRWGSGWLEVVYKAVGKGTAVMAQMPAGAQIEALVGLGNGFSAEVAASKRVLLIGGGVGTPPLLGLARALRGVCCCLDAALGFAGAPDVFFTEEFSALGCKVHTVTEDGSAGQAGFVTAAAAGITFDYYFACGPAAMLRAVFEACEKRGIPGQLSFEERMGCGFGVCMGCTCHTAAGPARVCADGPVFTSGEVVFP